MATFEERLTAIEQEHAELKHENAELKQKLELHTIAIGALVNKAALERLNERYDKLFESLIAHDQFTNTQLSELRTQQIELDGKLAGLQTEMRQGFEAVNGRFEAIDNRFETLEQSVNSRFEVQDKKLDRLEGMLTQILARLPEKP